MRTYSISYKMNEFDEIKRIRVTADNKEDAYDTAVFDEIPAVENSYPYSAWVSTVYFKNGDCKDFNTCEGMPY